jgi:uncharacterized repeat protein (TIGR03803 family)
MKQRYSLVSAFLSAAVLTACGSGNSLSSSPMSVTPQIGAHQFGMAGSVSQHLEPSFAQQPDAGATYKVLYRFPNFKHGANPFFGKLIDVHGMLYGTTFSGGGTEECPGYGRGKAPFGCGTVYEVNPSSGAERVIHSFRSMKDGLKPWGGLVFLHSRLYGTTWLGGHNYGCDFGYGCGTVFEVNPSTGAQRVIYTFGALPDAQNPQAALIAVTGVLYGTSCCGGSNNDGTVFKLTPSASGFTESVLYSFGSRPDGNTPQASLIPVKGTLYGTTAGGGGGNCKPYTTNGCGTVFAVDMHTGAERVLHSFKSGEDGAIPDASLIMVNGALYGTTQFGGSGKCTYNPLPGCGTVFRVNPATGAERIVHAFKGPPKDAGVPTAGLTDVNGSLYGTAGANSPGRLGIIFKLTPSKSAYTYSVVYWFGTVHQDGMSPAAPLAYINGKLYGTTPTGGVYGGCPPNSCGIVFELTP